MSTVVTSPDAVEPPAYAVARRRKLSTARVLTLCAVFISVALLMVAVVGYIAVMGRESATAASVNITEPLLVDAQTVYTSLSDADTTAAGALLAGPIEPTALRQRYALDVARASSAAEDAARRSQSSSTLVTSLNSLSVGIPIYTGLVQEAVVNNRLGYPVAGAYQGEASSFLRTHLLPAAHQVYRSELAQLESNQSSAKAVGPLIGALLLLLLTLGVLIAAQVWVRRRFRRRVNVGLLVATVLVGVLAVWALVGATAQANRIDAAAAAGTGPLDAYTQARQLALQARADDELTLVSRGSVGSYAVDFAAVWPQLKGVIATQQDSHSTSAAAALLVAHNRISALLSEGQFLKAIAVGSGTSSDGLPAIAAHLDASLVSGLDTAQQRFNSDTTSAANDLSGLAWGVVIVCLVALGLALVGLRSRAKEYS